MSENRIDNAFDKLDNALDATAGIREDLIAKLYTAAKAFDFNIANTDAEGRESFMSVINSLDGLLKGKEKAAIDTVKLSLQQRKDNDDHDNSAVIADLLASIVPGKTQECDNKIPEDIDTVIAKEYESSGDTIPDTELQKNET